MPTQDQQRGRRTGATPSTAATSRPDNSDIQQGRSLPPKEQQRRGVRSPQSGAPSADRSRADVAGSTLSGAASDFSGSGEETDERLQQEGIDGMTQAQRQDDGKVDVHTRQQPKYHSGKQTQR